MSLLEVTNPPLASMVVEAERPSSWASIFRVACDG
jgi:hypothetical protein